MSYAFPAEIRDLLDQHLESGRYASENAVLLHALQVLGEYGQAVIDIQEGMEDEAAGRLRPFKEADAEIRQLFGIPK